MRYLSVKEYGDAYGISERTVRNWCAAGKMQGAFLTGKTWNIPDDAPIPRRSRVRMSRLLESLQEEKELNIKEGIYHKTQVDFTYNSNRIEGGCLTLKQTAGIFENNAVGVTEGEINVDDIVMTANHFCCIDYIIDHAGDSLSESLIKELHSILKTGTSDSRKFWFNVGEYKRLPNEAGDAETSLPKEVPALMKELVRQYNAKKSRTLEDIMDFHCKFECIHPFQDGNGHVGRLIMFKECLANGITPFIITDILKQYYFRGLQEWGNVNTYMTETCQIAQDQYKAMMGYIESRSQSDR